MEASHCVCHSCEKARLQVSAGSVIYFSEEVADVVILSCLQTRFHLCKETEEVYSNSFKQTMLQVDHRNRCSCVHPAMIKGLSDVL